MIQDYNNWEIIVSDNCSEQDVKSYILSLNEPRIIYHRTSVSVSVTENWNNCIDRCSGDYILMLGDDDAIVQGYFEEQLKYIVNFDYPDLIYTKAYQYVYPNVFPGKPDGYVIEWGNAIFLEGKTDPFLIEKNEARKLAKDALKFKANFMYNMQFGLFNQRMKTKLKEVGPFFQSPYPDYYAMTSLFFKAEKILAVPIPMVIVGISPKSFGYYYFNCQEHEGVKFLDNMNIPAEFNNIKKYFLIGPKMNTCWLLAMEAVKRNSGSRLTLRVAYYRYRFLQVLDHFRTSLWIPVLDKTVIKALFRELYWWEKIIYFLPFKNIEYLRSRQDWVESITKWIVSRAYPSNTIRYLTGQYSDMGEVVKNCKKN